MSATPPADDDPPTPAERAALVHLEALRGFPSTPSDSLVVRIVHAARWQRTVLAPARAAAAIASAFGETLAVLLGRPARRTR